MKLKLPCGMDYGEGPDGMRICRGAKLGHANQLPDDTTAPVRLHLEKLRIDSGGYDQSGCYWGLPGNEYVYCAWGAEDKPIFVFNWARNRKTAKALVRGKIRNAKFFR